MSKRITFASLYALLFAMLLASAASAQVINGCVDDRNGSLRIVSDPAECTSRETPLSWNQVGPQGEPGADGVDGAPGADGSDAAVLRVFDGDGIEVGLYGGGGSGGVQVFDEANEVMFSIDADGSLSVPYAQVYFASTDCSGTPYFHRGQARMAGFLYDGGANRFFALEPATPWIYVSVVSLINSADVCEQQAPQDLDVRPGREVFLDRSFPLPAPLYVAPAPDVTPEPTCRRQRRR